MSVNSSLILVLVAMLSPQQSPPEEPVVVIGSQTSVVASSAPAPTPSPTPTPTPKPRKPPEAKVVCTPRMANSGGIAPAIITASVHIENPDERFWCPGVEWYVGEQFNGSQESDCLSYEIVVSQEGEPSFWSEDGQPRRFELWPGDYTIKARLVKSKKTIGEAKCTVYVH